MVMEKDDSKGSGMRKSHHVGVGGRAYPEQIGKSCTQQPAGDASKNWTSYMEWKGGREHGSHHSKYSK